MNLISLKKAGLDVSVVFRLVVGENLFHGCEISLCVCVCVCVCVADFTCISEVIIEQIVTVL